MVQGGSGLQERGHVVGEERAFLGTSRSGYGTSYLHGALRSERLWASLLSAAVAETLTLPIDVAKTRAQLARKDLHSGFTPRHLIRSMQSIVRKEGATSLFRGLPPALMRQAVYMTPPMALFEDIKTLLAGGGEPEMLHRFAAGGISGSIGIAIANPIERVKVILQDSTGPRESAIAVARRVMAKEGLPGFWAGLRANVARTFLVCAAEQGSYDEVKTMLVDAGFPNGPPVHLAASCIAAMAASAVCTPADTVKTRLMGQALHAAAEKREYRGAWHTVVCMVKEEGARSLFQGFVPVLARRIIWTPTFFLLYEKIRSILRERREEQHLQETLAPRENASVVSRA